ERVKWAVLIYMLLCCVFLALFHPYIPFFRFLYFFFVLIIYSGLALCPSGRLLHIPFSFAVVFVSSIFLFCWSCSLHCLHYITLHYTTSQHIITLLKLCRSVFFL